MKYKIVQCLSRNDVVEDKLKWIYSCKEWVGIPTKFDVGLCEHRVPSFLSLHAHLRMEENLEDLASKTIFPQFAFKKLLLVYDIIHGLICGYGMKEILVFWRNRP